MRFSQIISETTTSGSIATVSSPLGATQTRDASIYGDKKVGSLFKGKKTNKPYANSLTEGKVKELSMDLSSGKDGLSEEEFKKKYGKTKAEMRKSMKEKPEPAKKVEEAKLEEEDKIIPVGKGKKLKTGLHGKSEEPKLQGFKPPFKAHGVFVADRRGNKVCDCENDSVAQQVAKALTAFAIANEVKLQGAGVIAGGLQYESVNDKEDLKAKRQELQRIQMDPSTHKDPKLKAELARRKAELEKHAKEKGLQFESMDSNEYDMEGDFVKNQLHTMRRMIDVLEKRIGDSENLPEWVQMKISQAQGMMVGVTNYMISEKEKHQEKDSGIEGITSEGAKVDRMVKHIAKSERKLGKSKEEAENIAWATANKRGYLDNKNKKKH